MPAHFLLTMLCTPRTPLESHMLLMGAGPSNGGSGFSGPLDALVAGGASLIAAYSVRRLLSSYTGAAFRLRSNGTGAPEADIHYNSLGACDQTEVASLIASGGGSAAYYRKWYDQNGVHDVGQTNASLQPQWGTGSHAKGVAIGNGSGTKLDSASFTLSQPFTVLAVYNRTAAAGTSSLFSGISGSGVNNTIWDNNPYWYAQYGAFLGGANADPTDGTWQRLTANINGASSSLRVNAGTPVTGSAGTSNPDGIRLLGRADGAIGWNGACAEFVIFAGNPTGVAGWTEFLAEQTSYFAL